uniref:Putative cytochrome oxidase complex assembly protein 1 n=1 Tax=Xenopsylla cheopis TaxID=163159 RepID=A0A6M2DFP2_XENCH
MLRYISTKTLIKTAGYGALVVIGTGMYMKSLVVQRIKDAEFYRTAFKTLRGHPGAVHFLGEPIKDGGFKYSDTEKNNCTDTEAHYAVKVKGPNDKGVMFFWAEKLETEWKINRLELELNSRPGERLKIVGQPKNSQEKAVY